MRFTKARGPAVLALIILSAVGLSTLGLSAVGVWAIGAEPQFDSQKVEDPNYSLFSKLDAAQGSAGAVAALVPEVGDCANDVDAIRTNLEAYETAMHGDKGGDVKGIKRILELLRTRFNQKDPAGQRCYQVDAASYALGASGTLEKRPVKFLQFMTLWLERGRHLRAVSPEEAKILGYKIADASWAKTGQVIGWYDCGQNMIVLDPFHYPHDVAGVVAHEIDHLLRDKQATRPAEYGLKSWVLLDEGLASLFGGYMQYSLAHQYNERRDSILLADIGKKFSTPNLPDNHLFMHHGFIEKSLQSGKETSDPYDYHFLLQQSALIPCTRSFVPVFLSYKSELRTELLGFFEKDSQAYFHAALGAQEIEELVPEKIDSDKPAACYELEPILDPYSQLGKAKSYASVSRILAKYFNDLQTAMVKNVASCQEFEAALGTPGSPLQNYIGTKIRGKFGGEGAKGDDPEFQPSIPMRPCLIPSHGW